MAQLNVGSNKVYLVCIGDIPIKQIYIGSNLIYTAESNRIPSNLTTFNDIYVAMQNLGFVSSISVNGVTHTLVASTSTTNLLRNNQNSNVYQFSTSSNIEIARYIAADAFGYLYIASQQGKAKYVRKIQYTSSGTYSLKATYTE